jgi:SAM-dependent methyltransferase
METYTPGDAPSVTTFMARRTLASHGAFFRPFVFPGARILDCGAGPGTITAGLAAAASPGGSVDAIDANPGQVDVARRAVAGFPSVQCREASVYALPFEEGQFDLVFSHALFEHLADPVKAARELRRVLAPGGIIGLRSPDWGGRLAGPPNGAVDEALDHYGRMQAANGGNLSVGRGLGAILADAGFDRVRVSASYECYAPVSVIAEYLASQIEQSAFTGTGAAAPAAHASALRAWARSPLAFFAQAWCEAVAVKPSR